MNENPNNMQPNMQQALQAMLAQYGSVPGGMPQMMPPQMQQPQPMGMPVPQLPPGGFVSVPVKIHEHDGSTTKAAIMVPGMDYWQAKQAVQAMGYEVDSWFPKPRDNSGGGGYSRGGGYSGNNQGGGYGRNRY